jgi:hypothetical protein
MSPFNACSKATRGWAGVSGDNYGDNWPGARKTLRPQPRQGSARRLRRELVFSARRSSHSSAQMRQLLRATKADRAQKRRGQRALTENREAFDYSAAALAPREAADTK